MLFDGEHAKAAEEAERPWYVERIAELETMYAAVTAERDQARRELAALRPEVRAFAHLMEARLRANDHKGGWKHEDKFWLFGRATEELKELYQQTLNADIGGAHNVGDEAADVANFCMMIADVVGDCAAWERRDE